MAKHWIAQAIALLQSSRDPVPHEINELDWKPSLSDNKERLIEHLIAFANYPQGGYLIYGIGDAGAVLAGVDQGQVQDAIRKRDHLFSAHPAALPSHPAILAPACLPVP